MTEFNYRIDFPPALKPEIDQYIERYKIVVPKWLNTVTFNYAAQPEDCDALLEIVTRAEYRLANVVVYADFMLLDGSERRAKCFLHEFSHVFSAQLHQTAVQLASTLSDEHAQNLAFEAIRIGSESLTEDITDSFHELLEKIKFLESELDNMKVLTGQQTNKNKPKRTRNTHARNQ